jgi:hypothetical protein
MAAIMQEWQAILATCKKIAVKTGTALPGDLQRMEGDVWARQAGRLRALSGWLRDVERAIPEPKPDGDQPPVDQPEEPKPKRKKAA